LKSTRLPRCLTLKGWKKIAAIPTAALATLAFAQIVVNYHDQDFTLSGFKSFDATLENGGVAFKGAGAPVRIEMKSSGTVVVGTNADGTTQKDGSGNYFLKEATISGNASLSVDSQLAYEYASQRRDSTQKPDGISKTQVQSELFKYTGTSSDGRMEFPGAVTIDSQSNGVATNKDNTKTDYARVLHLTGASGFVTLLVNAAPGASPLKTGELSGPVTYSGKSDATPAGGVLQSTTFDGKADHLKFDFTREPRTITMNGNVTLTSKGPAASGDISADNVIVTVDENLKPIKIDIAGSPAKTTMHQEPPK